MHQENNIISIGKRWVGYAFRCCGWDFWHSAHDPRWTPREGIFIQSVQYTDSSGAKNSPFMILFG